MVAGAVGVRHLNVEDVRLRRFIVQGVAVGHVDFAGLGVDREPAAGVVQQVQLVLRVVRVDVLHGHVSDERTIGGVLADFAAGERQIRRRMIDKLIGHEAAVGEAERLDRIDGVGAVDAT